MFETAAQRAVAPAEQVPALVPGLPPEPAVQPSVAAPSRPDSGNAVEPAATEAGPSASANGAPAQPDALTRMRSAEEVVRGWYASYAACATPDTLLGGSAVQTCWLDLTSAHPSGLAQLMAGRTTRLSSLVREPAAHAAARRRARLIRAVADELAAERGMRAGYLAAGLATWRPGRMELMDVESPGGVVRAPVLLRACVLRPRDAAQEDFDIDVTGTPHVNPELLHRLQEEHGVLVDGDALAGLSFGRDGFDPRPVFDRLEEICSHLPGFKIERVLAVAALTAGSGALLADLGAAVPAILAHPLLGRVARQEAAQALRATAGQSWDVPSTGGLQVDPDSRTELLPLDLDLAQHRAVDAAIAGEHVALEGPPGSGLTHTLAAASATLAAQGRHCLVVTPRRATADAFIARLAAAGLSDLVLDVQDGVGDRNAIHASLSASLEATLAGSALTATDPKPGFEEQLHATLHDARDQLDSSIAALHEVRSPWGVSAFSAMAKLAELMARPPAPRTGVRLSRAILAGLDDAERQRLGRLLTQAATAGAFTLTTADTAWFDAKVSDEAGTGAAYRAATAAQTGLGQARLLMSELIGAAGLRDASTVAAWRPQLDLLLGVRATLDQLLPAVFEQNIADLLAVLGPDGASGGVLARRSLRKRARNLVRPGVQISDLRAALAKAHVEKGLWAQMSGGASTPQVPPGLPAACAAVDAVQSALTTLDAVLAPSIAGTRDGSGLAGLPLDDLAAVLDRLVADERGLLAQPERTVLLAQLRAAGLDDLVTDLRERAVDERCAAAELDLAWWAGVLEAVVAGDPRLARHDGRMLRRAGAHFRLADWAHIREGSRLVRRQVVMAAERVCAAKPDQVRWVRAEVARGHRSHWPQDLIETAPDVLAALRPIWVMSPDAVARLLPAGSLEPVVDVVLVDDAGQVALPEVAAAICRASQLVVAGDRRRMPPEAGMRSLLDAVAPIVGIHRLDRDHRTFDGRMLSPLMGCYPEGWRVTPGTSVAPRLTMDWVIDGTGVPGPGEEMALSPDGEVWRVVELVCEHARQRPDESLMVVTLGERHAERIEEALRARAGEDVVLAGWLQQWWTEPVPEPFLVRPVDRVLGIERDDVIVTIGIASTPHGRVLHRFGVIDEPHGEAVLLTALSRGRRRVLVVCTFTADQLDPARLRSSGARLLRRVLQAAQHAASGTGGDGAGADDVRPNLEVQPGQPSAKQPGRPEQAVPTDQLVADLAHRLRTVGLPVTSGFGDAQWPLDLAIGDPRVPGRQIMAVDVDGPRFAEAASVRDRERHRRERYERAGWTYCKVAAMDLFQDPEAEVARLRDLWESALGEVVTASLPILPPVAEKV